MASSVPPAAGPRLARAVAWAIVAMAAAVPVSSFLAADRVSLGVRLGVGVLAALAAARPGWGLVLFAGLGPMSPACSTLWGVPVRLMEPLLLAVLAGWMLHEAVRAHTDPAPPWAPGVQPAALLALAVTASCAVQLTVARAWVAPPHPALPVTVLASLRDYFSGAPVPDALSNGAAMLEGLGLFVAVARTARREPPVIRPLTRMLLVGLTGVAVLGLNRMAEIWLRVVGPDGRQGLAELLTHRVTAIIPDVNAAGSAFALVLGFGVGLALGGRPRRWLWLVPSVLVGAGIWLTGSRAAVMALPVALLAVFGLAFYSRERRLRTRVTFLSAVGVLALVMVWLALYGPSVRRTTLERALNYRLGMYATAARMAEAVPVFGVGIGRFREFAYEFSSPDVQFLIGAENAHNNYLQVLAELGGVGFVLFASVAAGIFRVSLLAIRRGCRDPILWAALVGLAAFGITCLAGHPLLVADVSSVFWLVCGLAAALAANERESFPDAPEPLRRPRRLTAALVALALCVTLPYRMAHALDHEDLATAWPGFGEWVSDATGTGFRPLAGTGQFHIPEGARSMRLPVRLPADSRAPVSVRLEVDGRPANVLRVGGREWQWIETVVPSSRAHGRRFLPARLSTGGPAVEVGRPWFQVPPIRRSLTPPLFKKAGPRSSGGIGEATRGPGDAVSTARGAASTPAAPVDPRAAGA